MALALPRLPSLALDPKRIAANSVVIALHAAVFVLLLMPISLPAPDATRETITNVVFDSPRELKPLTPVPVTLEPRPRLTPIQPLITRPPTTVPSDNNVDAIDPAGTDLISIDDSTTSDFGNSNGEPALAQLTLLSGPAPRYPQQAARAGQQGEVLLRVLVDASGLPQEVLVERSSGFRLLDLAALREVKSRWRFQPAMIGGRAVAAFALVPIRFTLPD